MVLSRGEEAVDKQEVELEPIVGEQERCDCYSHSQNTGRMALAVMEVKGPLAEGNDNIRQFWKL